MKTFAQHLAESSTITKAQRAFMKERYWRFDNWYYAWKTTELPNEVEQAIVSKYGKKSNEDVAG